jgi:hypothetical protein
LKDADLVISSEVKDISFLQFEKAAQAITIGEKAVSRAIQRIKQTSVLS